jgi:hypothetical protein
MRDDLPALRMLLRHGADHDRRSEWGRTPLYHAAVSGSEEVRSVQRWGAAGALGRVAACFSIAAVGAMGAGADGQGAAGGGCVRELPGLRRGNAVDRAGKGFAGAKRPPGRRPSRRPAGRGCPGLGCRVQGKNGGAVGANRPALPTCRPSACPGGALPASSMCAHLCRGGGAGVLVCRVCWLQLPFAVFAQLRCSFCCVHDAGCAFSCAAARVGSARGCCMGGSRVCFHEVRALPAFVVLVLVCVCVCVCVCACVFGRGVSAGGGTERAVVRPPERVVRLRNDGPRRS